MLHSFHLEVLWTRPALDGAERMFHSLAPDPHGLRLFVEPPLQSLDDLFVFPSVDTSFFARCALVFERTAATDIGPVMIYR